MSDTANDEDAHRRRHSQSLATPYLEFDLVREIEHLHGEAEWKTGRNARTIVKYDNLRIVLIALKAHVRIPEHRAEGRISIQTIRGQILVRAEGRTFALPAGTLLALDQELQHDVEALEDSVFLLTIALPGRAKPAP